MNAVNFCSYRKIIFEIFYVRGSEVKQLFNQVVWLRTDGSLFPQTVVWRKLQHHLLCVRVINCMLLT